MRDKGRSSCHSKPIELTIRTPVDIATDCADIYGPGGLIPDCRTAKVKGAPAGGFPSGTAMVAATLRMGSPGLIGVPVIPRSRFVDAVRSRFVDTVMSGTPTV